jgi:hypothetical protein
MTTSKDFVDSVNEKNRYENFSEEVKIEKETTAGKMTIYTVTNKNGVTFQKVPGQPGLEDRGFMGFVQGDRARPIMLSGSVRVTETESDDNSVTGTFDDVDVTPSVGYDIELTADAGALGDDTETKTGFILVG